MQRLLDEARMAAKLKHPGLVAVYDVQVEGDSPCIVQELIDGPNLREWMHAANPSREAIVRLAMKVADAVGFAHQHGFVHRDLKPANILIDRAGQPHVADFGLAVHETQQPQQAGEVSGTPGYMSPEQVRGETHLLDGRADLWALGVILYELLTGRRPFAGTSGSEVADQIQHKEVRPLRQCDSATEAGE